jgi:hypothetical protein
MGPEVETRQQFWGDHKKPKEAEASNTYGMPTAGALGRGPDKGAKYTIPKTGAAEEFATKVASALEATIRARVKTGEYLGKEATTPGYITNRAEAAARKMRLRAMANRLPGEGVIAAQERVAKRIGDALSRHSLAAKGGSRGSQALAEGLMLSRETSNSPYLRSNHNFNVLTDATSKLRAKTASAIKVTEMYEKTASAEPPDDNLESPVSGEQPDKNPQAQAINPRVDVSQQEPPKVITKKEAQYHALPSQGMYPLDSYADVKMASAYYDEWGVRFSPEHSHEYCCNLVKRAEALGIKVSDTVRKYGSEKYASAPEISAGILGRLNVLQDEEHRDLLSKLASERMMLTPDLFAATLSEFDKLAGLDQMYGRDVLDPYYTTFGFEKTASETLDDDDGDNGSHIIGNDYVTNKQLKRLVHGPMEPLKVHYGEDFVEEFRKDPIGIFKSMPADQKKHISRMAAEEDMPTG